MKIKFKKVLAIILTLALSLTLLAGCGEKTTSETGESSEGPVTMDDVEVDINLSDKDGSTQGNATQGSSTAGGNSGTTTSNNSNKDIFKNIPKALKGTTVTIATWGDESGSEYVKVQKKFTEETGIKVKWVTYGQSEYASKVVTQINAGKGPDIIILNSKFPVLLEAAQELPSYFNINDGFWDPRVTKAASVNGKNYFVNSYSSPFTGGTLVYYNKKIFSDNGITSPADYIKRGNGSWSYENLRQCLVDVKKVGKQGGILESMVLAEQMGASLVFYDAQNSTFKSTPTDEKLIEALQWHAKCYEEGLVTNDLVTKFASGQVGICMTGSYGLKFNGYFKDLAPSDIGVVQLPTSFNGKELKNLPLILRAYGIAKGAKNVEGSYYFLRYFLDYDNYDGANAEIFANKVMEKYFVETQLNIYKNSTLYFEYYKDVLSIVGKAWDSETWKPVRRANAGQVSVELSKVANVCDNAVK